jgi:hypothetical protein
MADEKPSGGGGGLSAEALLIVAFIGFFILWVAQGGASRPLSFGGPFLTAPGTDTTSRSFGPGGTPANALIKLPQIEFSVPSASPTNGTSTPSRSNDTPSNSPTVPSGTIAKSSFSGKITLQKSASGARQSDPHKEYLVIDASKKNAEKISINGWALESGRTGKVVKISFGTELPLSGTILENEPIFLKPGDRAYVVTSASPIGASFRLNKCMGYFEQYQDFTPSISKLCPRPLDELEDHYVGDILNDEKCETFMRRVPQCTLISSIPPELSSSCRVVIDNYLHYNGCVREHQRDADFSKAEWRVYLDRTGELWRNKNETIRLLDAEGNLVDQYSY